MTICHLFLTGSSLDLAVYFMDNEYLKMSVRGGEEITAGGLFEEVMKACDLPDIARHAFSLWLVSDLLGKISQTT